jgi:hypothetical protein
MTISALSARLMGQWLDGRRSTRQFHRRLEALHNAPWLLATASDQRFPTTTESPPPIHHRLMGHYIWKMWVSHPGLIGCPSRLVNTYPLSRYPSP